jgi:hypothetical protein
LEEKIRHWKEETIKKGGKVEENWKPKKSVISDNFEGPVWQDDLKVVALKMPRIGH